jgi:hypothetical protein
VTEESSESLAWCLREDAPHVERHQTPDRCIRDRQPKGNERDTWSKARKLYQSTGLFQQADKSSQSTAIARGLDNVGATGGTKGALVSYGIGKQAPK